MHCRSRSGSDPGTKVNPVSEDARRLFEIALDGDSVARRSPEVEHERAVAIFDLLQENEFALTAGEAGPYRLRLGIAERRLSFDIHDAENAPLTRVMLPLTPFRSVIRDYFTVCEAYYEAIKTASRARIEAIDMGRRGLHDEGAEILRERLSADITVDVNTARRLFTLICVLHARN